MSREVRFQLPLPLEVEPILESLLGARVMAQQFRARSYSAGDYVADLIRAEAAKRPAPKVRAPLPPPSKKQLRRSAKPPEPEED